MKTITVYLTYFIYFKICLYIKQDYTYYIYSIRDFIKEAKEEAINTVIMNYFERHKQLKLKHMINLFYTRSICFLDGDL